MAWVVGDAVGEGVAGDALGDVVGEGGVGCGGGGDGVGAAGDGLVDGVFRDALVGVVDDGSGHEPLPPLVGGLVDGRGFCGWKLFVGSPVLVALAASGAGGCRW